MDEALKAILIEIAEDKSSWTSYDGESEVNSCTFCYGALSGRDNRINRQYGYSGHRADCPIRRLQEYLKQANIPYTE